MKKRQLGKSGLEVPSVPMEDVAGTVKELTAQGRAGISVYRKRALNRSVARMRCRQ